MHQQDLIGRDEIRHRPPGGQWPEPSDNDWWRHQMSWIGDPPVRLSRGRDAMTGRSQRPLIAKVLKGGDYAAVQDFMARSVWHLKPQPIVRIVDEEGTRHYDELGEFRVFGSYPSDFDSDAMRLIHTEVEMILAAEERPISTSISDKLEALKAALIDEEAGNEIDADSESQALTLLEENPDIAEPEITVDPDGRIWLSWDIGKQGMISAILHGLRRVRFSVSKPLSEEEGDEWVSGYVADHDKFAALLKCYVDRESTA